ncbi:MAG: electron transfer flavoprotein subunit alpha/FixB family protein [Promethearchaeota archaeon]
MKDMKKFEQDFSNYKDVWVFTEIQDHERVLDGSLELLTKGRELADKLGEKLVAVTFGLNIEKYLPTIKEYGPDMIICNEETEDEQTLKHYNGEIFPNMWEDLIKKYKPSIILFPATEAGSDLAPRLAKRFNTGLTAHCSDLEISDIEGYGKNLLVMKRPAFSGNMIASIICPKTRPQMATVQQGVFEKRKFQSNSKENIKENVKENKGKKIEIIKVKCDYKLEGLKVVNIEQPTRWKRKHIPLEKADVIITGGRGVITQDNFNKLYEIANLLGAEVGATRVPVVNGWCDEERLIGQTGKNVKPDLYIGIGVSGQIQHTSSITNAKRIISINIDKDAPINQISDYIITADSKVFIPKLLERLKQEIKTFID